MPDYHKLIIALTGGMGSGKSQVARFFSALGIDVINADQIARDLTQMGTPAYQSIRNHFGPQILHPDQSIDRKRLQSLIFTNMAEKTYLETLLHPFIWDALKQRAKTAKSPYVILEIPLLFETTIETRKPDYIDRILVIDTLVENQIQRVKTRDKLSEEQIQEILKHQVSREYRLNHADDIIFNDGDLDHLHDQVAMCHARYLEMCTFP